MQSIDLIKVAHSELYLLALMCAFVIGNIIKTQGYFMQLYGSLTTNYGNSRLVLFIVSMLGGVLPIEGRITISAPILDSVSKQDSPTRQKMGIVDYLATHHYYFWSPIEPSVLIFLTALGISWHTFLFYTWPLLATYMLVFIGVLFIYVKPSDLSITPIEYHRSRTRQATLCGLSLIITIIATIVLEVGFEVDTPLQWTLFFPTAFLMLLTQTSLKQAFGYVNWGTILWVALIIAGGSYAKQYNTDLQELIQHEVTIPSMIFLGFVSAWILGSSSKYAGIGSMILVAIGNIAYLPFVLAVEYSGYILSPTHKCLSISKLYFNTKLNYLLAILLLLCCLLVTVGGFMLTI